jgi:16S rRNA (uracil1498-N3)-methyltransferase
MAMHRFFVPPDWIREGGIVLEDAVAHQIRNVLRMRSGDRILVLDNSGWAREVEILELSPGRVEGRTVRRILAQGEPRTKITLYQGVLKGRRFEFALQKGAELGIVEFVPLISDRAVVADLGDVDKRRNRWQRILQEAAEQSRRGRLPNLESAMFFPRACERAQRQGGLSLIAWEGEGAFSLRSALSKQERKPFTISLFVGPEGGFEEDEVTLAQGYGIQPITLGPRILRSETGGLVAATVILYEMDDLE